MIVRIHKFDAVYRGIKVLLLPLDVEAVDDFRKICKELGWGVGNPDPVNETNLVWVFVEGPTTEEFSQAFRENANFEFMDK